MMPPRTHVQASAPSRARRTFVPTPTRKSTSASIAFLEARVLEAPVAQGYVVRTSGDCF
jgi:hypothetical protein